MPNWAGLQLAKFGLEEFLAKQPGLRLLPAQDDQIRLGGRFEFVAQAEGLERIEDSFDLELLIPSAFPRAVITVKEIGERIPRSFHTNPNQTLCLGTPTRLRLIAVETASIPGFVDKALVPYLYGFLYYQRHHRMPFDELAHGAPGLLEDFASLFGANGAAAVIQFIRLTGMKRRVANKKPCPCGSGSRLGRCHNRNVNHLRGALGRQWFLRHTS